MNRQITKLLALALTLMFGVSFFSSKAFAENANINIGIKPTNQAFEISSNSTYDNTITITNGSEQEIQVELFSAPYSYSYSSQNNSSETISTDKNNHTQIARWITIADANGNYVEKPVFSIAGGSSINVNYRITTPNNIPAGGQYAIIFVRTISNNTSTSGIRAEPNIGMIIFGTSTEGESIVKAAISNMEIHQSVTENGVTRHNFTATATVKNEGNVDFSAYGKLTIKPIIGLSSYETEKQTPYSVIPDSELVIKDEWPETPNFGLFKATWTITTTSGETETIERTLFLISPIIIIITIIVLTIIIIWIIIAIRNRKIRRSRLAI